MTWFSTRFVAPRMPRRARPINPIHHPLSTVHALSALAAAGVLAAGCANLRWHKDGASAEALERDLAECRGEARLRAGPDAGIGGTGLPRMAGMDAIGRPVYAAPGRLEADRFLVEHDLTRQCMDRKGYALVPAAR